MNNTEIERKWLMDGWPPLEEASVSEMEQGYISFSPAVRIRASRGDGAESWRLTIKGGSGLKRTEVELALTADQYQSLLPLLAAPVVKKQHRCYALPGGLVLECNYVDEGAPTAFYYAEVEFETVAEAMAFVPPAWLGREVTEEPGHTMAAYCKTRVKPE